MKRILFIGIDFSKSKFDVLLLERLGEKSYAQSTFENMESGYKEFLTWIKKQSPIKREDWLLCGEHTGLYSRGLSDYLAKKGLFIWLENPLQIKLNSGIRRAKSDPLDSFAIAEYACRHADKAKAYKPAEKEINTLQLLVSYRSRLLKNKVALEVAANETRRVLKRDPAARYVYEDSIREIEHIKKKIGVIEKKMHETIMTSPLKENYLLICSIKGVGMHTAIMCIIHTNNFQGFQTARQIASYCGCAPFPNQSGTINKGSHISHLANKELKVLLSQCAMSAMQYNKEIAAYAQRMMDKGKPKILVVNNVRNKIIQRIFAVVNTKTPYLVDYLNPCEQSA